MALETAGFYASLNFPSLSSHTVRLQTDPQPDLLHERSYRTCFEPDNPPRRTASLVSAHPHHHGCQEGIINPATSTFRLVVVGRPCCRRGPWWPSCPPTGGGPACVVARNSDVNVIRAPRGPAPHGGCPSSASRCAPRVYSIDPIFATHATAPSNNPWYLKHLLTVCVPVWPAVQSPSPMGYLRHMRVDRLESTWDRG